MSQGLNGLVLAGGKSLRMGRDKGALAFHGQAQAQYLAQLLAPFVAQVYVSVRPEQKGAPHLGGLHLIMDYYASPSPLNGIVSAMRAVPEASWLVVAVDMPHIDAGAIETLMENRNPESVATCFESPAKGGPDPLFAIWEAQGFPLLEARLKHETAHLCPRRLLETLPAHIIRGQISPYVLDNVNTPEEWALEMGLI